MGINQSHIDRIIVLAKFSIVTRLILYARKKDSLIAKI